MASRKMNMFGLMLLASVLLVFGLLAYRNDRNLVWFLPGAVAYVVDVWYGLKNRPRIVWDD